MGVATSELRPTGAVFRSLDCEAVNDSSSTFRLRGKERGCEFSQRVVRESDEKLGVQNRGT